MAHLDLDRHVGHAPEEMFLLVADLAHYPKFISNCRDMHVSKDSGAIGDVRYARMTLGFGPVTQAYTSKVTVDSKARTIAAVATDGPFRYLNSLWKFEPEGAGTRIRFSIDFKISNPLIAAVAEPAFAAKQQEIMDAFIAEADRRYPAIAN